MDAVSPSLIAERALSVVNGSLTQSVMVRLFAPRVDGDNWSCAYEIGWPQMVRRNAANGLDSVQALLLALQMVGAELYAGRPAGVADAYWLETGGGVGFPLPRSLRDQAVGEDRLI